MADDHPICGYPTTNRNGRPCQHRVPREGLRCHDHPRTPDEDPSAAEEPPQPPRVDGGAPVGSWAEAVACVSDPVRTLSADGSGDPTQCELCGDGEPGYYLELEYPPDSDADPGMLAGSICGDCADAWATNLLVERAHSRDIDIYDGLP